MARELQMAFLPNHFPTLPRGADQAASAVKFCSIFHPTSSVSGDFFNVVRVSDTAVGVFICDVMGHGVRAALVTAMMRALEEQLGEMADDPGALLTEMNRAHAATRAQSELEARIASYELAYRMQAEAPDAVDLTKESEATKALYGLDQKDTADFGRMCLLSRRLVERGVRFVQLFNGAYASGGELNWDGHNKLKEQYDKHAAIMDQPAAALITDLQMPGLGGVGLLRALRDGDPQGSSRPALLVWWAREWVGPDDTGVLARLDRKSVV